MRSLFFYFMLFSSSVALAQSESDISSIRIKVEKINTDSKKYNTTILKSDLGLSTEGNETTVYTDQLKDIKLIKEIYYSEMGKLVISNYLENNQPIFIFKEYYTYKNPITFKEFNSKEFTKTEERFYVKNGRVIRWMKDKKNLKKLPNNAAVVENNMIENVNSWIAQFNKENKE